MEAQEERKSQRPDLVVLDEARFKAEMERIGAEIPEYVLADAGEISDEVDPEEQLEHNALAAEKAEEG